jgi:hypothetical protein
MSFILSHALQIIVCAALLGTLGGVLAVSIGPTLVQRIVQAFRPEQGRPRPTANHHRPQRNEETPPLDALPQAA